MSAYNPPVSHNGSINLVYNPSDYLATNSSSNGNFLPLTGGTITGLLTTSRFALNTTKINLGSGTTASSYSNTIALGTNSSVTGINSVAIGNGSTSGASQITLGTINESTIVKGTATSTTTSNGALVVGGGVGIGGSVNIGGSITSGGLITANGGLTMGGSNNITLGSGATAPTSTQLGYNVNYFAPTATIVFNGGLQALANFTIASTGLYLISLRIGITITTNTTNGAYLEAFLGTTSASYTGGFGSLLFQLPLTGGASQYVSASTLYTFQNPTANKVIYINVSPYLSNNCTMNGSTQINYTRIA